MELLHFRMYLGFEAVGGKKGNCLQSLATVISTQTQACFEAKSIRENFLKCVK